MAQPGPSSSPATDDEPSTSACPPPKRQKNTRTTRVSLLSFLKEESEKEDWQFEANQGNTKCFLDLFEELVKKNYNNLSFFIVKTFNLGSPLFFLR